MVKIEFYRQIQFAIPLGYVPENKIGGKAYGIF
jgi:hypothetical protein